jgi:uncharacterized protein
MDNKEILKLAEDFARDRMKDFDGGHDWNHVIRVKNLAKHINSIEKIADPFMLEIAAVLHDTIDSKFLNDKQEKKCLDDFLDKAGLAELKGKIIEIIGKVSFSSKSTAGPEDPVLMVMQDADRLDAIGAIGIARAFNYGGYRNNMIWDPDKKHPSTIAHFYEKLLKLRDMMNTATGKRIADERHRFLETFLEQFYKEWNEDGNK